MSWVTGRKREVARSQSVVDYGREKEIAGLTSEWTVESGSRSERRERK